MEYTGLLVLIGRILYGGFFVYSGYGHIKNSTMMAGYAGSQGVPSPKAAVLLSGLLIILGGLGIMLGVMVTWAVAAIVLFLVPTTLMMHKYWTMTDPNMKMNHAINFRKNIALLGAALMFLAIPQPWMYSL